MRGTAEQYREAGLCVLPARRAEKRPAVRRWKQYQSALPTSAETDAWFANGHDALCLVCGEVSGNLEMIDFDHGGMLYDEWSKRIPDELLAHLVVETSQSGGKHVVYRCETPVSGNLKLASRRIDGKLKTLIETRGEGGLFLCAPTEGYELIQGDLADPPTITESERDMLMQAAWALGEPKSAKDAKGRRISPHNATVGQKSGDNSHNSQCAADNSHNSQCATENSTNTSSRPVCSDKLHDASDNSQCATENSDIRQCATENSTNTSSRSVCSDKLHNASDNSPHFSAHGHKKTGSHEKTHESRENNASHGNVKSTSVLGAEKMHANEKTHKKAHAHEKTGSHENTHENREKNVSHRPGDDFNSHGDVGSFLESHGWTYLRRDEVNEFWRRPGKESGQSATVRIEDSTLYVFSSNATPFEPNESYSPFAVYAHLEHSGDFSAATRALSEMGFGESEHVDDSVDISAIVEMSTESHASSSHNSHNGTIPAENSSQKSRKFKLTRADQIEIRPPDWLLRGMLERDTLAMVFGDPGSGKSFLSIDWACRIATGTPWRGHAVPGGPVVYIAGEGQQGFGRRIRAWEVFNDVKLDGAPLFVAPAVGITDSESLNELVVAIEEQAGPPALIVLDTLARCFGGGDENSTQDMGLFVAACDDLRKRFGCTVLVVHHSGHSDKNRARGAIALKAALDAEYRMSKTDRMLLTATKMKEADLPPHVVMDLNTVKLPGLVDDYGNAVASAALEVIDAETGAILAQNLAAMASDDESQFVSIEVPMEDFIEVCLSPHDPCLRTTVLQEAKKQFGLSERHARNMLDLAQDHGFASKVSIGSRSFYVKNRPGVSGEKSLWIAALLANNPDADAQEIGNEVGATRQHVNRIRRILHGTC